MRPPTRLARDVAGKPGVGDVRYDRRWLARLVGVVTTARLAGALVAGILMLGAAFTVAAVVRLSLYARRDELEIMQLVGAPFSYIRGPFIVEGLLLGGIGAAVALVGDCNSVFDAVAVAGLRPGGSGRHRPAAIPRLYGIRHDAGGRGRGRGGRRARVAIDEPFDAHPLTHSMRTLLHCC